MILSHDIMTQVMISPTPWEGKEPAGPHPVPRFPGPHPCPPLRSSPPVPLSGPHPLSPSPPCGEGGRSTTSSSPSPEGRGGQGVRTRWRRGGQGEDPRGVRRGRACHASHFPWSLSVTPVTTSIARTGYAS